MKRCAPILFLSAAVLASGCARRASVPPVANDPTAGFKSEFPREGDAWTLVERDVDKSANAFVGGLGAGFSVGPAGATPRTEGSGAPLNYDYAIEWAADGVLLDPHLGTDYSQKLDLKRGSLTTAWRQRIGKKDIDVESQSVAFGSLNAQRWRFKASETARVTAKIGDLLCSANNDWAQHDGALDGEVGDSWSEIYLQYAPFGGIWVPSSTFSSALNYHEEEWSTDIEIEGPLADQQAVRSFLFYLRALYSPNEHDSFSPFGSSSGHFAGRTFWDADCWLLPAFALTEPNVARAIASHRLLQANQTNYMNWIAQARPTATGNLRRDANSPRPPPIKVPWQSDQTGQELSDQPTRFEEHVSGDLAWGLDFAASLGLAQRKGADRVIRGVAAYYLDRASKRPDGKWGINDVVSVDEWHTGGEDLYTNAVADWTIRKALGEKRWPQGSMFFPHDEKGLLAYEGDMRRAYQQATGQLVLWPLEREDLAPDPLLHLALFEGKEAHSGPAMTVSLDALLEARYGDPDRAHIRWLEGWQRYLRGNPFLLFSEKSGQHDRTYFGTGAAGCLNAVIYGFIGARVVENASSDAAKIKLEGAKWLVFRPNLPKSWKKLTFKGVHVMGRAYTVTCIGRTAEIDPDPVAIK